MSTSPTDSVQELVAEVSGKEPMLPESVTAPVEKAPELGSLTSTITDYIYRNGRRYSRYREGIYPLPNDEPEKDRQDFLHHIFGELFGGRLVFSPLKDPKQILDVGCGTGIWAMDVADEFPSAQVTGTDLSPIQPRMVPENLQFEIDDAESEWTYPANHFDLIHFSCLGGSICDWPNFLSQAYKHLKPGAYIEALEPDLVARSDDNSIPISSPIRQFEQLLLYAGEQRHQTIAASTHLPAWLAAAGFADVEVRDFKLPLSSWPKNKDLKRIGYYQNAQFLDAIQPYALGYLVDALDWTREQMEVFLVGLRGAVADRSIHAYHIIRVITARKPLDRTNMPPPPPPVSHPPRMAARSS